MAKEFNEKRNAKSTFSASQSKIMVEGPLADLELGENTETWQKFHGHAIATSERLQEKGKDQRIGDLSLLSRKLWSKNRLGSTWMFQCENWWKLSVAHSDGKSRTFSINWLSSYWWWSSVNLKGFYFSHKQVLSNTHCYCKMIPLW